MSIRRDDIFRWAGKKIEKLSWRPSCMGIDRSGILAMVFTGILIPASSPKRELISFPIGLYLSVRKLSGTSNTAFSRPFGMNTGSLGRSKRKRRFFFAWADMTELWVLSLKFHRTRRIQFNTKLLTKWNFRTKSFIHWDREWMQESWNKQSWWTTDEKYRDLYEFYTHFTFKFRNRNIISWEHFFKFLIFQLLFCVSHSHYIILFKLLLTSTEHSRPPPNFV